MRSEEQSVSNWQKKISLFLDNQLSEKETASFLEMVQNNPSVSKWVENEREFRKFLITNIPRPEVTDDLAIKVRKIENAL